MRRPADSRLTSWYSLSLSLHEEEVRNSASTPPSLSDHVGSSKRPVRWHRAMHVHPFQGKDLYSTRFPFGAMIPSSLSQPPPSLSLPRGRGHHEMDYPTPSWFLSLFSIHMHVHTTRSITCHMNLQNGTRAVVLHYLVCVIRQHCLVLIQH